MIWVGIFKVFFDEGVDVVKEFFIDRMVWVFVVIVYVVCIEGEI